ncbi:MAG: hypothetical protein AB8H79_07470 [Myxococcota bacterium]
MPPQMIALLALFSVSAHASASDENSADAPEPTYVRAADLDFPESLAADYTFPLTCAVDVHLTSSKIEHVRAKDCPVEVQGFTQHILKQWTWSTSAD